MTSIYNFDSLVEKAFESIKGNPATTEAALSQSLRSQVEATSSFLGRLWFRITHLTSIGGELQRAIAVARHALRGYQSLGPYLIADIGNIDFDQEKHDPAFEAFLQNHAGIERTPAKVGRCWANYIKPSEEAFERVLPPYRSLLARRQASSPQRTNYRQRWENNDTIGVYNAFCTELKRDPESIFLRYCIAHSDKTVLDIAKATHTYPAAASLVQTCGELDATFSAPEQDQIWSEIPHGNSIDQGKLSRHFLKRSLTSSGRAPAEMVKDFFLDRLRQGKSHAQIQREFETLVSLLPEAKRTQLQTALVPGEAFDFSLALEPSEFKFQLFAEIGQKANVCYTDPKARRASLFRSYTYLSQVAAAHEADIPVCVRSVFAPLPQPNDADRTFAEHLRTLTQQLSERLAPLPETRQRAILKELLPDAENPTLNELPEALQNVYFSWITERREGNALTPSEEMMQQNLLIGIPRLKIYAEEFRALKEQKGEAAANEIFEVALLLLGGGEASRGGLHSWIEFVSPFHPGRWRTFRKQFERSQEANENPERFKDRMRELEKELKALAEDANLPIPVKTRYPQIWKSLILPRFNTEEADAAFEEITAGMNGPALHRLALLFEAREVEFDEELSLEKELQLLAMHTDCRPPSNPAKYIQTMFPRLWSEHFKKGFPSDEAALNALNARLVNSPTLFEGMMGFLRARLEENLAQIGLKPDQIRSLIDQEIQNRLASPNPIFAGFEAVKARMSELELNCQIENLQRDASLLNAEEDVERTLQNLITKYPRIWRELILPAYSSAETAHSVFIQVMKGEFALETLLEFVEYSIKESVIVQMKAKGFTFDQCLDLWQAARQKAQAGVFDRIETAKMLRKHLRQLTPSPAPLAAIFGPLDSPATLASAQEIVAVLESHQPISPAMQQKIAALSDRMKDEETASGEFLKNSLLIAHLPEPIRKCVQMKAQIYEMAREEATRRFHQTIAHPTYPQNAQKVDFDPARVTDHPGRTGPLSIYQPFTDDAHRLPIIEFGEETFTFKHGMVPYNFLRKLQNQLGPQESLAAQSILRSDEVNASAEIFAGTWALNAANKHFIMVPRFERMKFSKFFNGSSSAFSLSGTVELQLRDHHSGADSHNSPPAARRKVHVEYRFLQNRNGEWIRSKPVWKLVEDLAPPADAASDGVAEKMEALLEDSAVDRELSRGQGILADKPGASAANPGTEEEVI